tara:strand:+ start:174 stop:863 length:690 start_codon:yes stop_codon:yes gene_type:complete
MNNIPYLDILILAMIAVFIVNRLKNTLGKKTGNEHDIVEKFTQGKSSFKESPPDKISTKRNTNKKNYISQKKLHDNPKVNESLQLIHSMNLTFSIEEFLEGAKKAFEYIINNYSKENLKPLKKLLSNEIFNDFQSQIKEREKQKENLDITIIGIKEVKIVNSSVNKKKHLAEITVNFLSEQVHVTKNFDGKIVDGDSNQILDITENWIFSKNLKDKDPNWTLNRIEESD